jgi:inner membrane protein
MHKTLFIKLGATLLIVLFILVPLSAIEEMVHERQGQSASVLADIQRTGVGEQTVTGPVLIVPYHRTTRSEVPRLTPDGKEILGQRDIVETTDDDQLRFLPDQLAVEARVGTELRYRGIYSALLYTAAQKLTGTFVIPAEFGLRSTTNISYQFDQAYVAMGVSDTRGIKGAPTVIWNGAPAEWKAGTETPILRDGVHAGVGRIEPAQVFPFSMDLTLAGSQSLAYIPVGKQTAIAVTSDWPHPSFHGQFLPDSRTIGKEGFRAQWHTSHLSSNVATALSSCVRDKCDQLPNTLGVSFVEPVNVYLETARAAKYGFLFVFITFLVFQLFELLEKLAIHPVQYGLVGIALAMFFLLLLALTEHVSFPIAYLVASVSCVGLLAFYVSFVLGSVLRAGGFTTMLSVLYAALYVLLRAEDMSLLLGAGLLFIILATVMAVTRRVDWYRITLPSDASRATASSPARK